MTVVGKKSHGCINIGSGFNCVSGPFLTRVGNYASQFPVSTFDNGDHFYCGHPRGRAFYSHVLAFSFRLRFPFSAPIPVRVDGWEHGIGSKSAFVRDWKRGWGIAAADLPQGVIEPAVSATAEGLRNFNGRHVIGGRHRRTLPRN